MPNLYVIAGPNGAGKSTYVRRFLPQGTRCREFVNADVIAAEIAPTDPGQAAFEAGRRTLRRVRELAEMQVDFAFETTLSGRSYAPLLERWRSEGYRVRLDFLWVPELRLTAQRVRQRVTKGGHNIPEDVQRRRFQLGIRNLAELYRTAVDWWRLYDNTGPWPRLVAQEKDNTLEVFDAEKLAQIERSASVTFMKTTPAPKLDEPFVPVSYLEETRCSLRAMRQAFADVVLENLAFGLPVIQWRAERGVVEVPAEQLAPLARRILEVNGEPLPADEERALLAHVKV